MTHSTTGGADTDPAFAAPLSGTTTVQASSGIFISEYIEGTSNNKALEIYNGTTATYDLTVTPFTLDLSFNGGSTTGNITLNGGTLLPGGTYVLAASAANATILAAADQTTAASLWNGDDAITLKDNTGAVLDVFGQVGTDPGSEWGTGLTSTADNTLRRKVRVTEGDTNGSDAFDPSVQWEGFATDTFDGLGPHTEDHYPVISSTVASSVIEDIPSNVVVSFHDDENGATSSYAVVATQTSRGVTGFGTAVVSQTSASEFEATIPYTPADQFSGTVTFDVSVNDGAGAISATGLTFEIAAVNDFPAFDSSPLDQNIVQDTTAGPVNFTISDVESAATALIVTASSSNLTLLPNANITLGGTTATRNITMTPAAGQTGISTITLTVQDEEGDDASANFDLIVTPSANVGTWDLYPR
ncbi:lamin tail domain-containing protein [Candidatus Poribacteria bacterium]|nr:lamin tail domain-containing protein [Candidatus Poribacteria bacterium]